MKRVKRIIILLLVITGLYLAYHQVTNLGLFGMSNKKQEASISKNTKFIEIDVSGAKTMIIPEERSNLKAVYNGKQKLNVSEQGDTVEVSLKGKWFHWFNWDMFKKKNTLKIYIPKNYDQNMDIEMHSGSLSFSGESQKYPMELNELTVDIGSGNTNLQNLSVKDLNFDVSSGNVNINSLKSKTGTFDVSSGNFEMKHYTGAIDAEISSGKMDIQMDTLTDSINIDVSSGMVGLDLPNQADFTLNGNINSGHISCDLPLKNKKQNKDMIQGTHGNGKHPIELDISSGKIRIY